MPLQVRRGTTAEVNSIRPLIGELVYDTQLKRVLIGDSLDGGVTGTLGGTPIAGITANEAKDAAAASLLAGTHQNISFTYNSTTKALSAKVDILVHDTIEADAIDTAAIKDGSTIVLDVANALLIGDVKGSVFMDDSTPLVDAVDGRFFGDLTGNVTGNVIGSVNGNVITNSISSSDSSIIAVNTDMRFLSRIFVDNDAIIGGECFAQRYQAETSDINANTLLLGQHHNDSFFSSGITLRRSRNTFSSPTVVQPGDQLYKILFSGYDGSIYKEAAGIRCFVDPDGVVSSGAVPGKLQLSTVTSAGVEEVRIELDSIGQNNYYGINRFLSTATEGIPLWAVNSVNSGGNGARFMLRRTRGSYSSPVSVVNGDSIYRIGFGAHDGTAFRDVAFIKGTVDDVVSTGVVPVGITIQTTNSSGTTRDALKITKDQELKINKIETLNTESVNFQSALKLASFADTITRDAAITTPSAGMLIYLTSTNKFQGYVTSVGWVDLN